MEKEKSAEGLRFSIETITGKELLAQLLINGEYDGEFDPRFLSIHKGGVFHYSPLEAGSVINKPRAYYSVLRLNDLIIGLAEMMFSPREEEKDVLWFTAISIDKNLKGQGYSDQLLREVFRFAKSKNAKLWLSRPSPEGRERVIHKVEDLAKEYGVEISNGRGEPFTLAPE